MNAFRSLYRSRGAVAFGSLTFLTVAATFGAPLLSGWQVPAPPVPPAIPPVAGPLPVPGIPGQVNVMARLSQTKVAQGRDGRVYLELGIETPAGTVSTVANEKPTDMILVLDRSGSMADARKMDYAKSAIRALVDRMTDRDRLALVSFDDTARTDVELTQMNGPGRDRVRAAVDSIYPGSSTNISAGFDTAGVIAGAGGGEGRSVRVLLLSDGEANSGVMTQEGLAGIAAGLARKGAVVSTIGLGEGYNQNVLAAISDHGMGTYNYLESLEGLGRILEADLRQSRALYASASEVTFRLASGVRLDSAGDYPFQIDPSGVVHVQTGQLLSGARKAVTLTLAVPTDSVRERGLGELAFGYDREGKRLSGHVGGDPLRVSVVERESDAYASIYKDVYYKGWYASNVGNAKKAFAKALSSGDRAAADQAVKELQGAAAAAPSAAGFGSGEGAGAMAQLKAAAAELLADESSAFTGDAAKDASNQNLIAKKQHAGARALQRQE